MGTGDLRRRSTSPPRAAVGRAVALAAAVALATGPARAAPPRIPPRITPAIDGPVYALLDDSGSLLVGGTFTSVAGEPVPGLVRLRPDGTAVALAAAGAADSELWVWDLTRDRTGRVLAAGHITDTPDSPPGRGNAVVGAMRLLPDGRRDPGLSTDGCPLLTDVAELPHGVLLGLSTDGEAVLCDPRDPRLRPLPAPAGARAIDVAVLRDGSAVVAFEVDGTTSVVRYLPDGKPAAVAGAYALLAPRGRGDLDLVLALRDELPIVAGFGPDSAANVPGGLMVGDVISAIAEMGAPAVETRGLALTEVRTLLRGRLRSAMTLRVRSAAGGEERQVSFRRIDEHRAAGPGIELQGSPNVYRPHPSPLEPTPDGGLLVAVHVPGDPDLVLRIRPDGTLDRRFLSAPLHPWFIATPCNPEYCITAEERDRHRSDWSWRHVSDLALDARGRIYVGVYDGTGLGSYVVRLRPDGALDRSFQAGRAGVLWRVAPLSDGWVALGTESGLLFADGKGGPSR